MEEAVACEGEQIIGATFKVVEEVDPAVIML